MPEYQPGLDKLAAQLTPGKEVPLTLRLAKVISVNAGANTAVVDVTNAGGSSVTIDLASGVLPIVNQAIWVAELGSGRWLGLFPWPRLNASGAPIVLNNGTVVGQQTKLNFVPGPGILIAASNDTVNSEIDITHAVEQEYVRDTIAAFVVPDINNTTIIAHDDPGNLLRVAVNEEWLTDYLALHLLEGTNMTIDFNDATNALVFNSTGGGGGGSVADGTGINMRLAYNTGTPRNLLNINGATNTWPTGAGASHFIAQWTDDYVHFSTMYFINTDASGNMIAGTGSVGAGSGISGSQQVYFAPEGADWSFYPENPFEAVVYPEFGDQGNLIGHIEYASPSGTINTIEEIYVGGDESAPSGWPIVRQRATDHHFVSLFTSGWPASSVVVVRLDGKWSKGPPGGSYAGSLSPWSGFSGLYHGSVGGSVNHRHADRHVLTWHYPGTLPQARVDIDPEFHWPGFQSVPNGMFGGSMADPGAGPQGTIWVEQLVVTNDTTMGLPHSGPFRIVVRQNGSGLVQLTWNLSGASVRQTWINTFPPESGTFIGMCSAQSIFQVCSGQNLGDRGGVYVHMYMREAYDDGTGTFHLRPEVVPL